MKKEKPPACFLRLVWGTLHKTLPYHSFTPCSLSLMAAATIIIFVMTSFVATKHVFCRDKSMLVMTKTYVRTKYFCVATNIIWSQQAYICCDKHVCRDKAFFTTNTRHDKHKFCDKMTNLVATSIHLMRQTRVCRDKAFFTTNTCCHDKHKFCDKQNDKRVCRDKTFVATKMILAAAPANDSHQPLNTFM